MGMRMRTWLRSLVVSLIAGACAAAYGLDAHGTQTFAPRSVVQSGHTTPVVATLWAHNDQFVVSIAEDGSLRVWSVDGGYIIDRGQVPLEPDELISRAEVGVRTQSTDTRVPVRALLNTRNGYKTVALTVDVDSRAVTRVDLPPGANPPTANSGYTRSSDGRWAMPCDAALDDTRDRLMGSYGTAARSQCSFGVDIRDPSLSRTITALVGARLPPILAADMAPGGTRMVQLIQRPAPGNPGGGVNAVMLLDLADATNSSHVFVGPVDPRVVRWRGIEWRARDAFVAFGGPADPVLAGDGVHPDRAPFPTILAAHDCLKHSFANDCPRVPWSGLMTSLDDGSEFVGSGSVAPCDWPSARADGDDRCPASVPQGRLFFYRSVGAAVAQWEPRHVAELEGLTITALEVSPDRRTIAVAGEVITKGLRKVQLFVLGVDPAVPVRRIWSTTEPVVVYRANDDVRYRDQPLIRYLTFTPDGGRLLFGYRKNLAVVTVAGAETDASLHDIRLMPFANENDRIVTDGRYVLGLLSRTILDLRTGMPIAPAFEVPCLIAGGVVQGKGVFWGTADDGITHYWSTTTGAEIVTLYSFPGNRFFAVTAEGRYDTNLPPDTRNLRWVMPDRPWQSLAPQTFMRDFYEPLLVKRLLDCNAAGTCDSAFRKLPRLDALNRLGPTVNVRSVSAVSPQHTVDVCVTVEEGVDMTPGTVATHSGLHDLRLFRDGRLVAEQGAAPAALDPADLAAWRQATAIPPQTDCGDHARRFTVAVPEAKLSVAPSEPGWDDGRDMPGAVAFTAYAFNDDRIKGDTSPPKLVPLPPPAAGRRSGRVYVVAIGIDTYVNIPDKSLRFAANDATAITAALRAIPGRDVVLVTLTSVPGVNHAMKADLRAVIAMLAGEDMAGNAARLRADGIDVTSLQKTTPDDDVILTYSGHGFADDHRNFYLLPSDSRMGSDGNPDPDTMISSAELTEWLRAVDSADMALVIDACHSAASVSDGEFKPGPMGDPGLGQLAFDKGIRILAAAQADDVALENDQLQQGLLTFALTGTLGAFGSDAGEADLRGNGRISVDEWLHYAAKRVPSLSEELRSGQLVSPAAGSRGFTLSHPSATPPSHVQEPALFDFTGKPSRVIVKELRP